KLITLYRSLAHAQVMRRAYAEAEQSYLAAAACARTICGEHSLELYGLLADLGMVYEFAGNVEKQIATAGEASRLAGIVYAPDSAEVVEQKLGLSNGLRRSGCADEARRAAEEALDSLRRTGSDRSRLGAVILHQVAFLALQDGDLDLAEDLARE